MKSTPLFVFVFLLSFWGAGMVKAQNNVPAKFRSTTFSEKQNIKEKFLPTADVPFAEPTLISPAPEREAVINFREDTPFSVPLGSSYNIYSVVSEGPNAVNYVSDINALVFCHRQNFPVAGGSGIISFDVSTDNGATWDTLTKQVTPSLTEAGGVTINGNRYPNGAIYNPPGNTDPANAKFVSTGAALWTDPVFGNGWGWEFVASADLDGSNINEAYYTTADSNIYLSMGMISNPDGSVWYANLRREQNLPHQLYSPQLATKLEYNETSGAFDRTAIELPLNFSSGPDSLAFNPRIAFGPDGQTGYYVVTGVDGDDDEIYPAVKPIIWKTTDGGDNWVKQPRVHYQTMDSLIAYTIPIDGDGDGSSDSLAQGSPQIPYMGMFDITVDAVGDLHIFASMYGSTDTASTAAEFGFFWVGSAAAEFFHFITNGQDWEHYRVTDWYNQDAPIGGENVDERTQASRSPDGEHVFFSFCKTYYEELIDDNFNGAPDIWAYAYRVDDGYIVDPKNFGWAPGTVFDDFDFTDVAVVGYFHMLSPVSIVNGEGWDHELPIVYGIPRDLNDDLQPIDYYFLRNAGFDENEFHERGGVVATKEPILNKSFAVYPNPSTGQVNIDLSGFEGSVDVQVYDMNGQEVLGLKQQQYQTVLDLNGAPAGIYQVRVRSAEGIATQKVIMK